MAGQYAKPRSSPTEALADGSTVPSFRGDILNGHDLAARGLDPQRLYAWRRRLGVVTTPTEFEEVVLRSSRAEGNDGERFEIVLCTGHVVRVPPSFDPTHLRRLLEVLEKAREC
jgi:hypothetical protein